MLARADAPFAASDEFRIVIRESRIIALGCGAGQINSLHLLAAILSHAEPAVQNAIDTTTENREEFEAAVRMTMSFSEVGRSASANVPLTEEAENLLMALKERADAVTAADLLLIMTSDSRSLAHDIIARHLDVASLRRMLP